MQYLLTMIKQFNILDKYLVYKAKQTYFTLICFLLEINDCSPSKIIIIIFHL